MAENAGHMRARMTVHVPAAAFNLEDFSIDHPGLASKSRVGGQDHPWAALHYIYKPVQKKSNRRPRMLSCEAMGGEAIAGIVPCCRTL